MISLLQLALANLDDIGEILPDLTKEVLANAALTSEQTIKRILIVPSLLCQNVETLKRKSSVHRVLVRMTWNTAYRWELSQPFTTLVQEGSHPCRLLRRLSHRWPSRGSSIVVVVCQCPHLPKFAQEFVT